ncbi:glycosyltransferase [Phenylobacterium sp.]|jgi:glycosyltransferase involved in cell wall biosynthesis|uniref:glycosyltransferase n=1 Tax=Phenylobacterium sp. TaxID=1871053 RepID=UPI002F3FB47F
MSEQSARITPIANGGVFSRAALNGAAHREPSIGQTVALPGRDAHALFRDDDSGRLAPRRASPFGSYPSTRMSRVGGQPRTAIIHYWLVGMRGGERVLERLIRLFPNADVFTHVYDPSAVSQVIRDRPVRTTFVQNLPGSRRHYQKYLPLMPMALEQLDLRGYDLIISSESGPAKGVISPPGALHVCYCHSPMRYLWDHYSDYRRSAGLLTRLAMPLLAHDLRRWDYASAARVDRFMANSTFIQQRIEKAYRRPSSVVYPPVDVSLFHPSDDVEARYLWVGQLTAYKRPDLAVDAFNALGLPLLVVGDGEMMRELKRRARPNVTIVPRLGFDALRDAYARCRALVFTAEEDFGMVPVEAMASGRPVLAYGNGGALDTVLPGITGLFFQEQTMDSLIAAVEAMEAWLPEFDPAHAVRNAERFSPERFDEGVLSVIAGGDR